MIRARFVIEKLFVSGIEIIRQKKLKHPSNAYQILKRKSNIYFFNNDCH